jgi:hypothetical protein
MLPTVIIAEIASFHSQNSSSWSTGSECSSHFNPRRPHLVASTFATSLRDTTSGLAKRIKPSWDTSSSLRQPEDTESFHHDIQHDIESKLRRRDSAIEQSHPGLLRSKALSTEGHLEVFKTDKDWDATRLIIALIGRDVRSYHPHEVAVGTGDVCIAVPQKVSD